MGTPLETEVAKRFGVLPNFFRLASTDPKITANLWGFAQFAYLDNPLPPLFKERLFVYLSRFCEVRYCIARHVGFLVGLGNPSGDSECLPQTVESVVPLLRRPLPHRDGLLPFLAVCAELPSPLSPFPAPDSPAEQALFSCATHVFLQTEDAPQAHEALRRALSPYDLEQLNLFLAFVRTAHYWTKLHPELAIEDDITHLLATHEVLADCILRDPEAQRDALDRHVATELASLRKQHESITQAYQGLSVDHQYVKHTLQETEENLRELVSVMPVAVYACGTDGIITYYNHHAGEIWGRTPTPQDLPWQFLDSRRIYGMDGTLLRPEDTPVKSVLATGVPVVNCEMVLERPDHTRINVLANITALRDSSGVVTGAVSVFQDITAMRRIQQEREDLLIDLERSNRELSQFSYNVSHDLQTPVRNVRTLSQLLTRRMDGSTEDSRWLTLIEQSAAGMERLIASLLTYAQAGQGVLKQQRVDVMPIIESIRMTLGPLIEQTGTQITIHPLPAVDADPVLLEHLLQNLVANALQYHRPEAAPVVEISGEFSEEGIWQFAVKDNGQGIPREYQDLVFEPLKRLHGNENPGTGLGLAFCRTIVARHGGRIWVESSGTGHGSTFRFTLTGEKAPAMVPKSTVA